MKGELNRGFMHQDVIIRRMLDKDQNSEQFIV